MPRKSLHGRTCGVSCEGGRARALQPSRRSTAPDRPLHDRSIRTIQSLRDTGQLRCNYEFKS
ncbi:hypothetical protein XarCFBP6762_15370 [Xanthomonas arboricola]|nr:hypothetical protein XarCFBP6762_15370 [Xanthomonas arboricola]